MTDSLPVISSAIYFEKAVMNELILPSALACRVLGNYTSLCTLCHGAFKIHWNDLIKNTFLLKQLNRIQQVIFMDYDCVIVLLYIEISILSSPFPSRVCSPQCSYGFIYDGDQLKVTCFQCRNSFCAHCKKPVSFSLCILVFLPLYVWFHFFCRAAVLSIC